MFLLIFGCSTSEKKSGVATTIYPFKAILQEIAGSRIEIKSILPAGVDPHTYEMIPSDLKTIQQAAVFFYGAESLDGWAANIETQNKVELIKLVPKEYLINIKILHTHNYKIESLGIDPHFWLDPLTVKAMIPYLVNELIKVDPSGEKDFKINANKFSIKLSKLDKKIRLETKPLINRTVFMSHPFFSYFFTRYNFDIAGSLEIAPGHLSSPKEIKDLMDLVKKKNVKAIFTHKQHSNKPAKVLAESTGINQFELDPIGGIAERMTYEEMMLHNLSIIKQALK
jgi:zinc transport system substrate-binding protein